MATDPHRRAAGALDDERLTDVGLLFEATASLSRALERRMSEDCGLSVQWFEVLLRLARSPGGRLRMSDLAAQVTLTPSGLTRAVDRLEAAGLVQRASCPSDRRGAFAELTPAGTTRIEEAVPTHLAHIDEVLGGLLAPDDRRRLGELARAVRDGLSPQA